MGDEQFAEYFDFTGSDNLDLWFVGFLVDLLQIQWSSVAQPLNSRTWTTGDVNPVVDIAPIVYVQAVRFLREGWFRHCEDELGLISECIDKHWHYLLCTFSLAVATVSPKVLDAVMVYVPCSVRAQDSTSRV